MVRFFSRGGGGGAVVVVGSRSSSLCIDARAYTFVVVLAGCSGGDFCSGVC